jgi:hypothetical protein
VLFRSQEKYASKKVRLVVISPNDDKAVRFDELGYKTLKGQAHAIHRFCDVTLRTDAHYLVEKKLL